MLGLAALVLALLYWRLSVLVVWLLVKYFLRNFNLDHKEEKEP